MIKHSQCVTKDGRRIGIEYAFTIIDGKQVNIQGKVEELRRLSKTEGFYCRCGCGTQLIPVFGDRHLIRQHFREKSGTRSRECTASTESEYSFLCKVALKLWMEDKMSSPDIETRVPLSRFEGTDRRFELTFYEPTYKMALCYWHERTNITSEKLTEIQNYLEGQVFYTVSSWNAGTDGQYPEYLIKLQHIQGYVAFLSIDIQNPDSLYQTARMEIRVLAQERHGIWKEIPVIKTNLRRFDISSEGVVTYAGKSVRKTAEEALERFLREEASLSYMEKKRAEEERAAYEAQAVAARKKREEEERKQREAHDNWNRMIDRMVEERQAAILTGGKKDESSDSSERKSEEMLTDQNFEASKSPIYDAHGARIFQCRLCGMIGRGDTFADYGFPSPAIGVCKACSRNGRLEQEQKERLQKAAQTKIVYKCEKCGADLVKKQSRGRWFWACSAYPACKYTTNMIK